MSKLKLTAIGDSTGIILPKEVLERLKVREGDIQLFTGAPDGFRITPYDPKFERQMESAEKIMRERRDLLRELSR